MIPLVLKLKRKSHKEVTKAQDVIVEELYKVFDNAVIHGGTAIWRCYGGNRFSEDVDVYLTLNKEKINKLFENFEKRGFFVKKKKLTENSIYSNLMMGRVSVKFEAFFKKTKGILKEYECADGNFLTVYTLSPEELIKEKSSAYIKRLKVRDLYDVFFLLRYVKEKEKIKKCLLNLVEQFEMPVDNEDLKVLIIGGIVPLPKDMVEYIKRWIS